MAVAPSIKLPSYSSQRRTAFGAKRSEEVGACFGAIVLACADDAGAAVCEMFRGFSGYIQADAHVRNYAAVVALGCALRWLRV